MFYGYLHGFASGPESIKARQLGDRFRALNLTLHIPDLNQNDFTHLTLSRQIAQVKALLPLPPQPAVLIGSSFGGLTAAWLAEQQPQIQSLILLAPAFQFLDYWVPQIGDIRLQQWQQSGSIPVYHYAVGTELPLHYGFIRDLQRYDQSRLQRPVPTLILHGRQDTVIPIQSSRDYVRTRPWARLVELDSDHALTDVQTEIWGAIAQTLNLPLLDTPEKSN